MTIEPTKRQDPSPQEGWQLLLEAVARGQISVDTALDQLQNSSFTPVADFAKIDTQRQLRTGFPEVIWGKDKTSTQISQIIAKMQETSPVVMVTRLDENKYLDICTHHPSLQYYPIARIAALGRLDPRDQVSGKIAVVTAGTADLPIAEEAAVTAELTGFQVERLADVGVAGIHRLLSYRQWLDRAEVIIVVAGMEGALVSVIAGLVSCPVIAVPTSIGYGTNFAGLAPLLTMLNSCAAGVGVVNIDNGFGAAILAGKILLNCAKTEDGKLREVDRSLGSKKLCPSNWQLAYSHDAEGNPLDGSIDLLLEAVRQGNAIRLSIELSDGSQYILPAENLWLKHGIVYAQNQSQISTEFRGEILAFTPKLERRLLIASSQGNVEIVSLSLAKGKVKKRSCHRAEIKWYLSPST
jgi:pyridinium-3,5-biscarboxylic acid mononucleotide synthase